MSPGPASLDPIVSSAVSSDPMGMPSSPWHHLHKRLMLWPRKRALQGRVQV